MIGTKMKRYKLLKAPVPVEGLEKKGRNYVK